MDSLPYVFAVFVLLAAALAALSVWSRRRLWIKLMGVLAAVLFIPVAYASMIGLLSRPKPVDLEWAQTRLPEATVLGATIEQGRGIYLWLKLDDVVEPRAYVLPWDMALAQQLQNAMREAEENGTGLRMRLPFENSLDMREPKFYALPQPALPPKDVVPETAPQQYRHPTLET